MTRFVPDFTITTGGAVPSPNTPIIEPGTGPAQNVWPPDDGGGATPWPNPIWLQANWYVDYVNGRDDADGKSPATAVRTVMGGVVAKWATVAPLLSQTTTIHILTSQPLGAESIVLEPVCQGAVNFVIQGTLQPVAGGTFALTAVTHKNRATNTPLSATVFPGAAAIGQVVHNQTHDSYAIIRSVGGGTAILSQPQVKMIPGATSPYDIPAEVDTWAAGDIVTLFELPTLNLRGYAPTGFGEADAGLTLGLAWLDSFRIPDVATATSTLVLNTAVTVAQLVHVEPALIALAPYFAVAQCVFEGGVYLSNQGTLTAGIQKGFFPCDIYDQGWILDNDCVFLNLFIWAPTEFFEVEIENVCTAYSGGVIFLNRSVWGTGTLNVYEGGICSNEKAGPWANVAPIGNFSFENDPALTGSAYVSGAPSVWTGGILPSIATLDAHGSLINPLSGSRFYRSGDS